MKLERRTLTWIALLFAAGACKDSTGPAPVALIQVDPSNVDLMLDQSRQLSARLYDANGNALTEREVTWASEDPSKVTVTQTGFVTAVGLSDGVAVFARSEGISGSTVVTSVVDLAGEWNFDEQAIWESGVTLTCENHGSYHFLQAAGAAFRGSMTSLLTCPEIAGDLSNLPWPDSLADIELSSTFIRFRNGGCQYEAGVRSIPNEALIGTVECASGYSGTWGATRGGQPIATIDVRWDVATVPGAAVQLMAVPRDAAGHVLHRSMVWTGDNDAVARVTETGYVTSLATGTARITATSEGRSGSAVVRADEVSLGSVSIGFWTSCALAAAGQAYCWGWGGYGERGAGVRHFVLAPEETQQSPTAVAGNHGFVQVDAGHQAHACGVTAAFEAYCWGTNFDGQIGDGSIGISRLGPTKVAGGELYTSVATGAWHSCGLNTSGSVFCWGYNDFGQLGTGDTLPRTAPSAVVGNLQFRSISAGDLHTCGVGVDSAAYCWGSNARGKLGDGTTIQRTGPVPVAGGLKFAVVSAGSQLSCGITVDGSAYCWGANGWGGLGNNSTVDSWIPVAVDGGHIFLATSDGLAVGADHACALTVAGAAYCWGYNNLGQLGDGSIARRLVPVPVAGTVSFARISTAGWHTCASSATGATWCWGLNADGQLGTETADVCFSYLCSTVPVQVKGQATAVRAVAAARAARPQPGGRYNAAREFFPYAWTNGKKLTP